MNTIVCRFCKKEKEYTIEFFLKSKRKKSGLDNYCRECNREKSAVIRENSRVSINLSRRISHADRKSKGYCAICKHPPVGKSGVCEKHLFSTMAFRHLGSKKLAGVLKDKLEKQNYKCAYSGLQLILGENASIDHIKSKVRHPQLKNDINNVHWVDIRVNLMKRELDESEFLYLIGGILNNIPIPDPNYSPLLKSIVKTIEKNMA